MGRKMKVYGGMVFRNGKQVRAVVAAQNQRRAAEIAGLSLHELRTYWSQTWNDKEVSDATQHPEILVTYG